MKALVLNSKNDKNIANIKLTQLSKPIINDNEILIKVHALGLNPVDYKLIEEHSPSWSYPHILGLDVAGEIVQLGTKNPRNFKLGDRVFFHNDLTNQGCYAEYAKAKYNVVANIPDNVSYEEAASVLCSGLTAYSAIYRKASLIGKKNILIHAGAGGVGTIAIQLAKIAGLKVITTVSEHKKDIVKKLGADYIIDYHNEDIDKKISEITNNNGVDIIINDIDNGNSDLPRLAYNGALICILDTPNISTYNLSSKGQSIMGLNLGGVHQSNYINQLDDLAVMAEELVKLISEKRLDPIISEKISFEDIPLGLEKISEHKTIGKIVATI
ncbi:zinc-binding dehydrogenase [Companilactobacillus allii]|uniref:Alcohol dehydrogenase n=1 Tax=Companilactobacillus allii TaxID=1847728 RepID=A0A1P8PZT2_9LACO|nr:zinc-binding dehydrogenase [Companilactobacillus allii]APX71138.1 alcohol dehydrogenase [Companilactobacillus allii]USQ68219.1 zinc-binding dehydrogenase [Companilactobacillus allii]